MRQLIIILLAFFCFGTLSAQEPIGKLVVGLEGGFETARAQNFNYGIQAEVPWKQFSFGVGIGRKHMDWVKVERSDGILKPRVIGEKKSLVYEIEHYERKAHYVSVPVKVNYRLPCNCVYIHAAAVVDVLEGNFTEEFRYSYYQSPQPQEENPVVKVGMKNRAVHYELGMGFKIHANDYFRIIARPVLVWNENLNPYSTDARYYNTVRMNLGIQYAFLRYGGKF